MPTQTAIQSVRDRLAQVHQEHLLRFYDELPPKKQRALLEQIEQLDLTQLPRWIEEYVRQRPEAHLPESIEPPTWYPRDPSAPPRPYEAAKYRRIGAELVSSGRVAAFCVAGGQGTRLGWDGPKGTYPATPVLRKPLFQVFAEQIVAAQRRYETTIPFYIMTSPLNHEPTVSFFKEHNFFGLDREHVRFFPQGVMPTFDMNGRILLEAKDRIAVSPDGHGGSLKALYESGSIAEMLDRGVEHISYIQVDNPLVKVIDPLFLGLHAAAPDSSGEMSSKMVPKTGPFEKVGNFCRVDGRTMVIEYSDLPEHLAEQRDENGELRFRAGSVAIHCLGVRFVEHLNCTDGGFGLPLHRADKKVEHIDLDSGEIVEPKQPKAVKLETFIFDALPLCESSIILETNRIEEFAPIKNLSGVDSAETSKEIQVERTARWLEQAGVVVPRDEESGAPEAMIEISPLTALEPADLRRAPNLPREIERGATVVL